MATVFAYLSGLYNAQYPEAYRADIEDIIREWRPDVWARSHPEDADFATDGAR